MRSLLCFLLAIGLTISTSAQKVYFIYFQTETGSPFYVRMGDKIHSSTSSGYMILSNLIDSTYQVAVGFPSSNAESKFRISLGARDRGYLIKSFDFGLGLYDMQALNIIKPKVDEISNSGTYRFRNDDFTKLLSRAARDTSLFWVPVAAARQDIAIVSPKPSPVKTVTVEEVKKVEPVNVRDTAIAEPNPAKTAEIILLKDSALVAKHDPKPAPDSLAIIPKDEKKEQEIVMDKKKEAELDTFSKAEPVIQTEPLNNREEKDILSVQYKRSVIKKYSESSTSEGFGLIYFDVSDNGTDTIRLIIPNPKIALRQDEELQKDEKVFLDITDAGDTDGIKRKTDSTVNTAEEKKNTSKVNCPATATDADFMKLRRNMAYENTDEAMVDEAKKYFRNKCFSTEQIKNLSVLFLTSAGKYLFFDAAYMHVTDQELFASLASEIRDTYYLRRFKALIGE